MKKNLLLFTSCMGLLYLSLSSYKNGPASSNSQDYTGRIISTNNCGSAGCHTGGTGTTTCAIEVRRKDWGASSTPVDGFIEGKDYLVTVKGTNAALAKFGFQLLVVEGAKNGNKQIGTFSSLPAGTHSKTLGGIDIIEHSSAMAKTGADYVVDLEWTAPATTTATSLTFCAIMNGVNDNNQESGDKSSAPVQLTLQNTTSVQTVSGSMHINAYPNPLTGNNLNLNMENVQQGDYNINVYDVNGANIYNKEFRINSNQAATTINTERWAAGIYIIHIYNGEHQKMINIVKQ